MNSSSFEGTSASDRLQWAGEIHPACDSTEMLLKDCQVSRARRSGPGGQHRNKVETAMILLHRPTGIQAEANERRTTAENRRVAVKRLRMKLALEVRCAIKASSPPSSLWQSRCRQGRIAVSSDHFDYPSLIAEALDRVFAAGFEVKQAAVQLACTSSQLVKFLKTEPRALATVNKYRKEAGMRELK